VLTKYSRRGFL